MCGLAFGQDVVVETAPVPSPIFKDFKSSNGITFGQPNGCAVPIYVGSNGVTSE